MHGYKDIFKENYYIHIEYKVSFKSSPGAREYLFFIEIFLESYSETHKTVEL